MKSKMKKEKFNPVFDGLAEFEMNQLFSELKDLQDSTDNPMLYSKIKPTLKSQSFVTP